jgi:putative transposase
MARPLRRSLEGVPLHIWQRGVDRQTCFRDRADYELYLGLLEEFADAAKCSVHAYVLMTNHVHLLITPWQAAAASRLMKNVVQRYSQHCNRTWKRSGHLWEGRFKSSLVDSHPYLLTCQRYIEMNPVRARMVSYPGEYEWSSFRVNAFGLPCALITPHVLMQSLGDNASMVRRAYRKMFDVPMDALAVDRIREAVRSGRPLGTEEFVLEMEKRCGQRCWTRKARGVAASDAHRTGAKEGLTPV